MQRRECQKRIEQYMTGSTDDHLLQVEIKRTYNHVFQKEVATYGICGRHYTLKVYEIEDLFGDFYCINVNRQKNHPDD